MISEVVSKESPENIAFTGSPLPLHQDLVYYESPPGIHLLHCLRYVMLAMEDRHNLPSCDT